MGIGKEEADLIDRIVAAEPYCADKLDERDLMLCDRLVSRGALKKVTVGDKICYRSAALKSWRY